MVENLIVLDSNQLILVAQVNQHVNHELRYAKFGVYHADDDFLVEQVFPGFGRYEMHVALKAKRLIEHGIPKEFLRVAVCDTPSGHHAVLIVKYRSHDIVLDNFFEKPSSPTRLQHGHSYRWMQIQTKERNWRSAGGTDHL